MRIGILGGTFNPIHNGHIKMAQTAKREYALDKVIFLTSGNPPHKRHERILDAKIRHIMVKKAISNMRGFEPCDYEVNRSEYSYTLNTMQHFKEIYPNDELFFIIGGDSLRDFDTWYKPQEILKLCTILVYERNGGKFESNFALPVHGEKCDISSTEIRELAKNGGDISGMVVKSTADFIYRHHLYEREIPMEERLAEILKPERYRHSVGVRDTAVKMADIFGADAKKAAIAGLLHDNAKNLDNQLERCIDLEAEIDEFERENPGLLHAKLGAETAKCVFVICDSEIIGAIRWHTIGRVDMTLLEKIIFVADLVEPNRTFSGLEELRKLAFSNIAKAGLACVRRVCEFNKKRGNTVHPNSCAIIKWLENENVAK